MLLPKDIMTDFPQRMRQGKNREMEIDPSRLVLSFKKPYRKGRTIDAIQILLQSKKSELVPEDLRETYKGNLEDKKLGVNHTKTELWVSSRSGKAISPQQLQLFNSKKWRSLLDWIGPVYRLMDSRDPKGLLCPLPNALLIKAPTTSAGRPRVQSKTLSTNLKKWHFKPLNKTNKYRFGYWYVEQSAKAQDRVYRAKSEIDAQCATESGKKILERVAFDSIPLIRPKAQFSVQDPLFPKQWNLKRIHADVAWTDTRGAGVRVVVMDDGCDLAHPDLRDHFSRNRGVNLENLSPPGACDPNESHGTACAGVLGASINNTTSSTRNQYEGIAGLAGECQIIPLAFSRPGSPTELIAGIEYAIDKGVDVISLSHASEGWDTPDVADWIDKAWDAGILICAAADNGGDNSIAYPARHPKVIACGAVDSDPNDSDHGTNNSRWVWSNYGNGLSVVAPGVNIVTAWNQGQGSGGSDYSYFFTGTSAAAPHVAGLAALLISAYPNDLRGKPGEIRRIIEESAEELPGYKYIDMNKDPNGIKGWNDETGFGLINVQRAFGQAHKEFGRPAP